jgi:hypothetical protein
MENPDNMNLVLKVEESIKFFIYSVTIGIVFFTSFFTVLIFDFNVVNLSLEIYVPIGICVLTGLSLQKFLKKIDFVRKFEDSSKYKLYSILILFTTLGVILVFSIIIALLSGIMGFLSGIGGN